MSAFSRGICLSWRCAPRWLNSNNPNRNLQKLQFFSSSSTKLASKKTTLPPSAKKLPPKPNASKVQPTTRPPAGAPVYRTYASTIAQKGVPIVLYKAPSHRGLVISSYSGAAFCFLFSVTYLRQNYFLAPADVIWWLPKFSVGISIFMAMAGTFCMLAPINIVKTIQAIPRSVAIGSGAISRAAAGKSELILEIELRKNYPIPFLRNRKLYMQPHEVSLPAAKQGERRMTVAEEKRYEQQLKEQEARDLEYERTHLLSSPFRHTARGFSALFQGTKKMIFKEGFLDMQVQGNNYRLDVNAWALENGRVLERLVTVKPGALTASERVERFLRS